MAGLTDFRAKHPEYNDMSDVDLATALHKKYYSDLPRGDVFDKLGVTPGPSGSTTGTATPRNNASALPSGMLEPGTHTPREPGFGGSVSFEFTEDGTPKEVVVPNVVKGKKLTNDEAIARYKQTGEHFGKFDTPANADAFVKGFDERSVAESSPMAKQEVTPKPYDPLQSGYAAVQGYGRGALNVGGLVGGLTNPNYEEDRAARAEEYPVESTLGYLGGTILGGGVLGKALNRVPGMAATAGQSVRNVLRLSGQGAAAGAAQAGAEGEDIGGGALQGAVAGPLAAGAVKAGITGVRAVGGLLSPSVSNANAIRALAKRVNSTPQELHTAMVRFRDATGRAPTLVEITDAGSAEELGRVAESRIAAADTFRGAEQRITSERPRSMSRQIAATGPTDTIARLTTERKDAMDAAMGRVRNVVVRVGPRDVERYLDPDVARVLNRDLRSRLAEAASNNEPARLTIKDIDDMRQAFGDAAGTGQRYVFNELADRIANTGSRAVPAYGSALSEYKAFSRTIKGFENGTAAKSPRELSNPLDIEDARTPEFRAGRNLGVRTRLTTEAGRSERAAETTANTLRQNAGTATEIREALGARSADRLQQLGAAETTGAERLAQASRAPKAQSEELERDIGNALKGAVAAGGHATAVYKANIYSRIIASLGGGISSNTARKLAEAATDPAQLPQVIAALGRAKLSAETIRSILLPAVARSAGAAAGGAQ